ncbi:MAG: hypothetical protein ACJ8C4_15960 [Gemmataceae bacterium]
MNAHGPIALASAFGLALAFASLQASPPDVSQLDKLPANTNAILAADVSAAYSSPIGQAQGWAKRYGETHHASLGSLPPSVNSLLVGARYDFGRMGPVWQIGLVGSPITLDQIAKAEGGVIQKFGNQTSAVESPRGAFFATVDNYQTAVFAPADRQAFARWLRNVGAGKTQGGSAFLRKALATRGNAPMMAAADLSDLVDPLASRLYFGHLPTTVKLQLNPTDIATLFSGLKGAILRINMTDRLSGQLQIEFSDDIGLLASPLPELLQDILADAGAVVSEIGTWKPTVAKNTLTLDGPLSIEAMRKIISLFELPGAGGMNTSPGETRNSADVNATLRYFKSVSDILAELRQVKSRLDDDKGYEKYAVWYDNYAKKIDYLPVVGVDPALVDFGTKTAGVLRAIGDSLRGVPLKTKQAGAGAYYYYSAFGQTSRRRGSWASVNVDTNLPKVRQEQEKIIAGDTQARNDAWKEIDDHLASIRTKMSEQFKLNF